MESPIITILPMYVSNTRQWHGDLNFADAKGLIVALAGAKRCRKWTKRLFIGMRKQVPYWYLATGRTAPMNYEHQNEQPPQDARGINSKRIARQIARYGRDRTRTQRLATLSTTRMKKSLLRSLRASISQVHFNFDYFLLWLLLTWCLRRSKL